MTPPCRIRRHGTGWVVTDTRSGTRTVTATWEQALAEAGRLAPTGSWMAPQAAARLIGVGTGTLAAWSDAGRLDAIWDASGFRRYHEGQVRALAEARRGR